MARATNSRTGYKYGICINKEKEDGTPCSLCANKEKQKISSRKDFLCQECGAPLREVPPPTSFSKYIIIGAVAVAALGTGAYFVFSGGNGGNGGDTPPPPPPVVSVSVSEFISQTPSTEQVYEMEGVVSGFKDAATAFFLTDATGKVTVARIAADAEVIKTLNDKDTLTLRGLRADENGNPVVAAPAEYVSHRDYTKSPGPGQPNPPYGTYDGPRNSSGQPHGLGGEVKVTKAYSLDMKDGKNTVVELKAGDKIVNTKYNNGKLVQGQLKRPDGTQKFLSIGN